MDGKAKIKVLLGGWINGSIVENMCSSSEEPGFGFEHPHGNSQLSVTVYPEYLMSSSGLSVQQEWSSYIHTGKTLIHKLLHQSLKKFWEKMNKMILKVNGSGSLYHTGKLYSKSEQYGYSKNI